MCALCITTLRTVSPQDKDFKLLQPGDPTFMSFSGETVRHQDEELYPFFINECAYYEKKIAFLLGKKIKLTLPSISVKKDWKHRGGKETKTFCWFQNDQASDESSTDGHFKWENAQSYVINCKCVTTTSVQFQSCLCIRVMILHHLHCGNDINYYKGLNGNMVHFEI